MFTGTFEYRAPRSLDEAIGLLRDNPDDAKILAGGHSLLPLMKLRFAEPKILVDIGKIPDLAYIREEGDEIAIGARTTHAMVEQSDLLRSKCNLLANTAGQIADVQVRNRGTIGGSLSHADPGADIPAACQALDAEVVVVGPNGERRIPVDDLCIDILTTSLQPTEIVREVRVKTPPAGSGAAYWKLPNQASHFAIVGVAVLIRDAGQGDVAIGVTGLGSKAYRATAAEDVLRGRSVTADTIREAAGRVAEGTEALGDLHASAEYRAHLAGVMAERALNHALSQTRG